MNEIIYTPEEVADLFSVSANTVRYWIRKGKLEAIKVGRHIRIRKEAVDSFQKPYECNQDEPDNEAVV